MAITTAVKGLENKTFGEWLAGATIADPDGVMVPFLPFKDLLANKKTVRWAKGQR